QIVGEIFGKIPYAHLSGPGFAREIIKGKPAKEVIASKSKKFLKQLKELFKIKPLEISTTADLIGVQLAGALKNALAIGISLVEAEYQNSKMSKDLIRLGLKEMIKLGQKMGAKKETFLGPVGRGDLILTSTNPLSRNFQFGQNILLDVNKMRREIIERKITVEGFDNAQAFYKLGKIHKLDLPMINEIYKVIYEKTSPGRMVKNLIGLIKQN
ncbi:MAG: glycerol-3-phosphate dehydrogenase, partial [Candidatus Nealsonbacteria bacterium CG23_combo_of_CG06-09_8_20_14_all_36_125]